MNNLEKELIRMKFPNIDVNSVLEILEATGNTRVATEILCGIYQNPKVKKKIEDRGSIFTFISFNKWLDEVKYSYEVEDLKSGYFDKSINLEEISLENWEDYDTGYSSDKVSHSLKTGVMKYRESTMSIERWNKMKEV